MLLALVPACSGPENTYLTDGATGGPDGGTTPAPDLGGDTTAPSFGGAATAVAAPNSITLSWAAAPDNVTQTVDMVYQIYQAASAGAENFTSPSYTTAPGATSFVVGKLALSTKYYFVVRAMDQAGNLDKNVVEQSATTPATSDTQAPSLTTQVQPIFTKSCTGAGCHSGVSPAQGLDLSSGKSYANLVNVASGECPATKRVLPSTPTMSYLVWKLQGTGPCFFGTRMPKGQPLAAADINTISAWVAAGAPNN
jgi:hypothetical protein